MRGIEFSHGKRASERRYINCRILRSLWLYVRTRGRSYVIKSALPKGVRIRCCVLVGFDVWFSGPRGYGRETWRNK